MKFNVGSSKLHIVLAKTSSLSSLNKKAQWFLLLGYFFNGKSSSGLTFSSLYIFMLTLRLVLPNRKLSQPKGRITHLSSTSANRGFFNSYTAHHFSAGCPLVVAAQTSLALCVTVNFAPSSLLLSFTHFLYPFFVAVSHQPPPAPLSPSNTLDSSPPLALQ